MERQLQKNIWNTLNISETTDIKKIRHAYAELSKSCHPEIEPEKFQQLFQAYQEALKWARVHKEREKDIFADNSSMPTEKSVTEYQEQDKKAESFSDSIYDNLEQTQEQEEKPEEQSFACSGLYNFEQNQEQIQETEGGDSEEETFFDTTYNNLFSNITPVVQSGVDAFQKYFEIQGEKDWKEYVTRTEFLKVQYDETFAKQLAEYFKTQTLYPVEKLPYDMVKELYFSYYPFLCEQTGDVFENGFTELFRVISQNEEMEQIMETLYHDSSVKSEVIKYNVYYNLYRALEKNKENQRVEEWQIYITDAAREMFIEDGKTSYRDKYLFQLLAFLIEEAPVLPDEIYKLLIEKFNLYTWKGSSKEEEIKPLYEAVSSKCTNMSKFQQMKVDEKANRRQLMKDIETWYYKDLTDADRPALKNYFNIGLFYEYRLDSWLLDYRLMVFALEYKSFPKVFLEEYLAFYDRVYAQTGSDVGRELYSLFQQYLAESDVEEEFNEIDENKREWVLQYFFEEGFTRVWSSSSKAAMKIVYKGIVMDHLTALAEQRNYEWDLWSDGHLKAVRSGENYIFSYDKEDEQVTLSLIEYFGIVEEMLELYMSRYFMTSSEKNAVNELRERARKVAYGDNRN